MHTIYFLIQILVLYFYIALNFYYIRLMSPSLLENLNFPFIKNGKLNLQCFKSIAFKVKLLSLADNVLNQAWKNNKGNYTKSVLTWSYYKITQNFSSMYYISSQASRKLLKKPCYYKHKNDSKPFPQYIDYPISFY